MISLPKFIPEDLSKELNNYIKLQEDILYQNIDPANEESQIQNLISNNLFSLHNFHQCLISLLIYKPQNSHFIQSLLIYLKKNFVEIFDNIKSFLFTPSESIDPNELIIVIGSVHLLRICFDSKLIDFAEILNFCKKLRNEKRKFRFHLIFLYLWFIREIEQADKEFASNLNYFAYKKSQPHFFGETVNYYLNRMSQIRENNWKVFDDLISGGYDLSTIEGAIFRDDVISAQKLVSAVPNYKWNRVLNFSLYDPIFIIFNRLNIMNFASVCNSINCFKYVLLNCPQDQKKHVLDESFEAAIIGGNMEIIHLIENIPEVFQDDYAFKKRRRYVAFAALYHRNEICDWLIKTKGYKIDETALIYAAKSGNLWFLINYFDMIDRFTYDTVVASMQFHHFCVLKFILASGKYDINECSSYKWTALHFAAANGFDDELKLLCTIDGISLNNKNDSGNTALDCATKNGFLSCIEILQHAQHS